MSLYVMKFTSSHVADLDNIRKSAGIVKDIVQEGNRAVVIVPSVPSDILRKFCQVNPSLRNTPSVSREADVLLASAAQQTSSLMALALNKLNVKAQSFQGWQASITTNTKHGYACIKKIDPKNIQNALEQGLVPVLGGYHGVTENGNITTFSLDQAGGFASAVARAVRADVCKFYAQNATAAVHFGPK